MKATVYGLDGEASGELDLPDVFETPLRPDLVRRTVLAAQANRKQQHGADPFAGLRTPAESFGSGRGMSHTPRQDGRARRVPHTVGGRKAHPPKAEKEPGKSVNEKERKLAFRSAVAATADADLVADRGHDFDGDLTLPVVVSDDFEDLLKTKEAASAFEAVGVHADVERADERTVRAGRGTTRGRTYKRPTSVLVVTSSEAGPSKAARNLAGADVATADNVDTEALAPGAEPGRLTVWTESAVAEVSER
ncbi:MAG: 50S ribosomal protein L4 [Halobacteriaceae archaeon]